MGGAHGGARGGRRRRRRSGVPAASCPPAAPARAAGALELPASDIVTFTGAIRAQHVATVGASVDGSIEMFLADVGQEVSQGDALARIGSPALASDRESAANAVERARDQVARLQDALNAAILEKSRAEADLERGQAELDRAHGEYDKQRGYYAEARHAPAHL